MGNTLEQNGAIQMQPSARALVEVAALRDTVPAEDIAPLYLRKSDAELNADRLPTGIGTVRLWRPSYSKNLKSSSHLFGVVTCAP